MLDEYLDKLETERPNPNTVDIDSLEIEDILKRINEEDEKIVPAIREEIPQIAKAVRMCVDSIKNGGRVIYVGAGTSGRIAFVDAVETVPTFNAPEGLFYPIIAGGKEALWRSLENVEDKEEYGEKDLEKANVNSRDIVIGITASGRTPYVGGALRKAREVGARTVLLCNGATPMFADRADVVISIRTGPEVITGSTRMKAGTSQKMVLNMISTATMIKLGKVYKNYMVDLQVLNEKLRKRAVRIISEVTGVDREVAWEYLKKADMRPKLAILMISSGRSKEECEEVLREVENLSDALEILKRRVIP